MKTLIEQYKQVILDTFYHLHEHPEISWEEINTTNYIKDILIEQGCKVRTLPDTTGVIGEIGKGKPVVAVRADIDALWQEKDGVFCANHSCGHDAHMAMVLGVVHVLNAMESLPKGTVRFIFQPAEEKGNGALKLVEDGVVDDVDFLYGIHLRPIQEMASGKAAPAIVHGAARLIEGQITGEDLHGARPHLGANAIEVGATLVNMLNSIHLDSMIPYSAKMTSFHAGGKSQNIIPGHAKFGLDIRAQTNETMDTLEKKIQQQVKILQDLYDVKIELETKAHIAAAVVNEEAQQLMEQAIHDVLGSENTESPLVTTGGDDFHFYTIQRTHLKATMLGLGCNLSPGLHHPDMTFEHEVLLDGTAILAKALLLTLEKGSGEEDVSNQEICMD
jgi:amidohydrolase